MFSPPPHSSINDDQHAFCSSSHGWSTPCATSAPAAAIASRQMPQSKDQVQRQTQRRTELLALRSKGPRMQLDSIPSRQKTRYQKVSRPRLCLFKPHHPSSTDPDTSCDSVLSLLVWQHALANRRKPCSDNTITGINRKIPTTSWIEALLSHTTLPTPATRTDARQLGTIRPAPTCLASTLKLPPWNPTTHDATNLMPAQAITNRPKVRLLHHLHPPSSPRPYRP